MIRQPNRRAVLAVSTVKAAASTALAGTAIVVTLGGAIANPAGEAPGSPDTSVRIAERTAADQRCAGVAGQALVRTPDGRTRPVSFKHGWQVYRGERRGTLLVVCPD